MSNIVVKYHNVNGLSVPDVEVIGREIDKCDCLVVYFLVETWFTPAHMLCKGHPYFVVESKLAKEKETGHQNAGLICMASVKTKSLIQSWSYDKYYVSVKIDGQNISCVYLPPSMSERDVLKTLQMVPVGTVVGDFNAHYGRRFGDKTSGPAARVSAINEWALQHSYSHLAPTVGQTTIDHVFSLPLLNWEYHSVKASIGSDHPNVLKLMGRVVCSVEVGSTVVQKRYRISRLDNPAICSEMICVYEMLRHGFDLYSEQAHNGELTVDEFDSLITEALQVCADFSLGEYDVNEARKHPHAKPNEMSNTSTVDEAIQIFKKSNRLVPTPIVSRRSNLSPLQDVTKHYQEVFTQTEGQLKYSQSHVPIGIQDFHFSCQDVRNVGVNITQAI